MSGKMSENVDNELVIALRLATAEFRKDIKEAEKDIDIFMKRLDAIEKEKVGLEPTSTMSQSC